LTRVPVNTRTQLLTERSDDMAITKFEDATSIVGEEKARELEEREQKSLVGKSAIVIKSDDESTHAQTGASTVERAFGGALTISDAIEYEEAAQREAKMYDLWYMLQAVMDNIVYALPEDVPDKAAAMSEAIEDFKSHIDENVLVPKADLDRLTAVLKGDFSMADNKPTPQSAPEATPVVAPAPVAQSQPHALDAAFATLRSAYDRAVGDPALNRAQMYELVQPAINTVAATIKRSIETMTATEGSDEVRRLSDQVASLTQMLQQAMAGQHAPAASVVQQSSAVPQPRQMQPFAAPQAVTPALTTQPQTRSAIRDLVRKSVGINGGA
jgi:hypothetical protein